MMAIDLRDDRASCRVGRRRETERRAGVDHRHHPAAQGGEPAHRRLGERDRDDVADIDDRCDLVGRNRDAAPRNMRDKEKFHQPRPPIAVVVGHAMRTGGTTGSAIIRRAISSISAGR